MTAGFWSVIVMAVLVPLLVTEFGDWCPWLAKRLVRWSAQRLGDPAACARYEEEWLANLAEVPGKLSPLIAAVGYVASIPRMRWNLHRPIPSPHADAISDALRSNPSVSIVIPALNEARNLPYLLPTLPPWAEVVLVDGGSVDDTVSVARRVMPSIKVVTARRRTGRGGALLNGFAACGGDIIVTMDAYGSGDGRDVIEVLEAMTAGADFVKGSGLTSSRGRMGRGIDRLLVMLVNGLFGARYSDLGDGCNAFWAKHLSAIQVDGGFEIDTQMRIRAAKLGLRVREIPGHGPIVRYTESIFLMLTHAGRILRMIMYEKLGIKRRHDNSDDPSTE